VFKDIPIGVCRPSRIEDDNVSLPIDIAAAPEIGVERFRPSGHGVAHPHKVPVDESWYSSRVMVGFDFDDSATSAPAMVLSLLVANPRIKIET
jgi:hypothetical protein